MVSVTQHYSHVANRGVDDLLRSGRSGGGVTKIVLGLLRVLLQFLLSFFLLSISLLDEIVFTYWLDDCAWCVEELAGVSICDNIFENFLFQSGNKSRGECFIADFWVFLRLFLFWHDNNRIKIFFLLCPMLLQCLGWLLIAEVGKYYCWGLFGIRLGLFAFLDVFGGLRVRLLCLVIAGWVIGKFVRVNGLKLIDFPRFVKVFYQCLLELVCVTILSILDWSGYFIEFLGLLINNKETLKLGQVAGIFVADQEDIFSLGEEPVFKKLIDSDGPGGKFLCDVD